MASTVGMLRSPATTAAEARTLVARASKGPRVGEELV